MHLAERKEREWEGSEGDRNRGLAALEFGHFQIALLFDEERTVGHAPPVDRAGACPTWSTVANAFNKCSGSGPLFRR
jgi:hypothetical protein